MYEEFIKQKIKQMVPLDNDAFAYFASHKSFCEEFLRVILEDDEIEVIDIDVQKFLPNMYFKNAVLDMLCKLKNEKIVNVEIQLYTDEDSAKRIMQYFSMIRQTAVEKGTKYKNINDVIVIYLSKKDIFNMGNTCYNIRHIVETDDDKYVCEWKCGLEVKYVNVEGMTNKKIKEYLMLLADKKVYDEKYPITNELKKDMYKGGTKMGSWMSELMEKARKEGMEEGVLAGRTDGVAQGVAQGRVAASNELLGRLVREGLITRDEANRQLALMK